MNDARRRRAPRIWDTDWMVLRQLASGIEAQTRDHVAAGSTFVDMGCGAMPYREMIAGLGVSYIGADVAGDVDILIDAQGKLAMRDGSADAILSVQVLEHVRDLDAYCAEICRLLKPDGTLLLSTHGAWLYHPHPEDHRRWTRTGLEHDLATRGLEVQSLEPMVGPLATTTLIRLTGFAFVVRKIPLIGRMLAGFLAVVMNFRALVEDAITPAGMRLDNACVYLVRAHKCIGR
jgi:SAM-dependent methyltransferase